MNLKFIGEMSLEEFEPFLRTISLDFVRIIRKDLDMCLYVEQRLHKRGISIHIEALEKAIVIAEHELYEHLMGDFFSDGISRT